MKTNETYDDKSQQAEERLAEMLNAIEHAGRDSRVELFPVLRIHRHCRSPFAFCRHSAGPPTVAFCPTRRKSPSYLAGGVPPFTIMASVLSSSGVSMT